MVMIKLITSLKTSCTMNISDNIFSYFKSIIIGYNKEHPLRWIAIVIILNILIWIFLNFFGEWIKEPSKKIINKIITNYTNRNDIKNIEDYFTSYDNKAKMNIFSYQFGLRPNLPLIDVLYLELIKKYINNIDNVLIFPSIDKSAELQNDMGMSVFENNIKKIFKGNEEKLLILNPFTNFNLSYDDINSVEYVSSLKYLNSEKFKEYVNKNNNGLKLNNISDFNKYHPENLKIVALVTHIYKAWEVRKKIDQIILEKKIDKCNLGFLFWETEFDKMGIYKMYAMSNSSINNVNFYLGKTLIDKRKKPIPVYEPLKTLNVFEESEEISLRKIANLNDDECTIIQGILKSILYDNYQIKIDNDKLVENSKSKLKSLEICSNFQGEDIYNENKYKKNKLIVFALLNKLQIQYEYNK